MTLIICLCRRCDFNGLLLTKGLRKEETIMKKKLLTLMIAGSLALSMLAGCSNSAKTDADLESSTPIESSDVTPSESDTQEAEASNESVAEENNEAAIYSVVITSGTHHIVDIGYCPTAFAKDAEGNEYRLILANSLS